jgi:hypothetical protein
MNTRTDRCYKERGSRTNYVRSSIPHCTYKRNINEVSCDHCCRGKAMSITYYSECVSVALVIHSMKRACAILSSVACPAVSYFSTLSHKRQDFRGEKSHRIQKTCFEFSIDKQMHFRKYSKMRILKHSSLWVWPLHFSVLPANGALVPKHVGVILIINCALWLAFYCVLSNAFVGQHTELRVLIFSIDLSESFRVLRRM